MAKTTRQAKSPAARRQKKSARTIDLEATEVTEKSSGKTDNQAAKKTTAENIKLGKAEKTPAAEQAKAGRSRPEPSKSDQAGRGAAKTTQPKPEKRSGFSFATVLFTGLFGGLIGGGLGLGGLGMLNQSGMLARIPVIGSLASRQDEAASTGQTANALPAQITQFEARLEQMENRLGATTAKLIEIGSNKQSSGQTGNAGLPESVKADIKKALDIAEAAKTTADTAGVKLDKLNQTIADAQNNEATNVTSAAAQAATETALAELEEKIGAVSADLTQKFAENSVDAEQLTGKLTDLEQRLANLSGGLDARFGAIDARLSGFETKMATDFLDPMAEIKKAANATQKGQRIAHALTARALGEALVGGAGFAADLASAQTLIGINDITTALTPVAQTGLPSGKTLRDEFAPIAEAILTLEKRSVGDDGNSVWSRLISGAKGLVKIRNAGPLDGDTQEAILSRVAHALEQNDYKAAQTEWYTLPEAARSHGANWQEKLDSRIKYSDLLEQLIGKLNANTGNSGENSGEQG